MVEESHVVRRLYDAFERGDGLAMEACYAEDAIFRDEVFDLTGRKEIGGMWNMLLSRATDLQVRLVDVLGDARQARATWVADYTFGQTGNKVHNEIEAEFVLRGDLIVEHHDKFDFWKWSRQALGPIGAIAGWTPWVRGKVQSEARRGLETYLRRGV